MATNMNQLAALIQEKINRALKENVAPVVKEQISETIKEVEYVLYTPTEYQRLGDEGGLSDVRNMSVVMLDDNTLSITNERMDGSVDVARIFATGVGFSWVNSQIYQHPFARDFYADTIDRLRQNQAHINALRTGLKAQGLNVI